MKSIYITTLIISGIFVILNFISIFYYKVSIDNNIKNPIKENLNKDTDFLTLKRTKNEKENSVGFHINYKKLSNKILFGIILLIILFIPFLNIIVFGFLFISLCIQKIKDNSGI